MSNLVKEPLIIDLQYLPSISWFEVIRAYEIIYLDKKEHYQKGTYRNRCHILSPNGQLRLSIPLMHGKQQHKPMGDVLISNEEEWQKIHWMTICSCYRRSAYFEYFEDTFFPFYHTHYEKLFDFNLELLKLVLKILKMEKEIRFTDAYIEPHTPGYIDMRSAILPNNKSPEFKSPKKYIQVFSDRFEFMPDLSIIDFIFNNGNKF
jgi:hypothetical protein